MFTVNKSIQTKILIFIFWKLFQIVIAVTINKTRNRWLTEILFYVVDYTRYYCHMCINNMKYVFVRPLYNVLGTFYFKNG